MLALEMIQVMSEQISFQQRLTLVLPLLSKALVVEKEEQKINSKVRAKALDVLLSLFKELEEF
jgi:hypothetical protein